MQVIRYNLGPLDNNTYVLIDDDSGDAAIVDPTFNSRSIWNRFGLTGLTLRYVLNTHAHIDHVFENAYFVQQSGAPLALHPDDQPLLDAMAMQAAWLGVEPPDVVQPTVALHNGGEIHVGRSVLRVVHTPGHAPGHVCFIGPDFAVVGDVLFRGSIGRTDLPGGNHEQLLAAIERELLVLPDETKVYPGHGDVTTIGEERLSNPYLGRSGTI